MEITYTLDKYDFLNHQLYLASKSERIKKARFKGQLWMIAMFLSLASMFYVKLDRALMFYFLGFAILAAVFYPYYSRRRYKRHYEKYIDENYGNRFDKEVLIQLEKDTLHSKDEISEGTLKLSALTEIVEVPTAIYIRFSTNSLLLPKKQINNIDEVRNALETIAINYNILSDVTQIFAE